MNKKETRQQQICNLLLERDHLSVPELCTILSCSEATIRNDLRELEASSMVKRIYGGVMPTGNTPHKVPLPNRQSVFNDEKDAIAKYVADTILQPNLTVILDAGTTSLALAGQIAALPFSITVLTNSIPGACIIAQNSGHRLHIAGGTYHNEVGSCHDQQTIAFLNNLHADIFFLCPTGISVEAGFAVPDQGGAEIKRVMMARANRVIALADYSKFDKTGLYTVCALGEVDQVITNAELDEGVAQKYRDAGLDIVKV